MIKIDFHCHTNKSYDGFTSYRELLDACRIKNINAISITEHDVLDKNLEYFFKNKEIKIIKGCEFTTDLGAHIIGLFISEANPKKKDIDFIINYILNQNGLILIPHPYKDITGALKIYKDTNFLEKCHLIEIVNGGIEESNQDLKNITNYAKKYNLKIVAGSDSHKVDQIGYYINKYDSNEDNLYSIVKNQMPQILYDRNYQSAPRRINIIQKMKFYQFLIILIPSKIRRLIKIYLNSILKSKVKIKQPDYQKLDINI